MLRARGLKPQSVLIGAAASRANKAITNGPETLRPILTAGRGARVFVLPDLTALPLALQPRAVTSKAEVSALGGSD